jgi:Mrp family chromosome partitioning ATPase
MTAAFDGAPGAGGGQDPGAASLVRAVRAHPLTVALIALVAVGAAALWLAVRAPTYQATAEILVTPAPDDGGPDGSLPLLRTSGDRTRIVQTAASLVDSAGAQLLTEQRMGEGWPAARVAGAVDVEPVGQTDVLAVTARDGDPAVAARLADTFAQAALDARAQALRPRFVALIGQLEAELRQQSSRSSTLAVDLAQQLTELRALREAGDPTLSLSRPAEIPTAPVGNSGALILLLALFAGLVVGVGTALILELVGPARVAGAAEASAAADSPVLARVPLRDTEPGRSPPEAVAVAFRMLQVQLDARQPPAQVVLLASPSAAEEAADRVADFGLTLAEDGRDVLIVDLDVAGSVAARLGADAPPAREAAWERALGQAAGVRGLQVVTVDPRHGAADAVADLGGMLDQARERFDHVLINAPPLTRSSEGLRVVNGVDAVVLLVRPRRTTMEDYDTALGLLQRTRGSPDGLLVVSGRGARRRRSAARRKTAAEAPAPAFAKPGS